MYVLRDVHFCSGCVLKGLGLGTYGLGLGGPQDLALASGPMALASEVPRTWPWPRDLWPWPRRSPGLGLGLEILALTTSVKNYTLIITVQKSV